MVEGWEGPYMIGFFDQILTVHIVHCIAIIIYDNAFAIMVCSYHM